MYAAVIFPLHSDRQKRNPGPAATTFNPFPSASARFRKKTITGQPVAELYLLYIYLSVSSFVLFNLDWKHGETSPCAILFSYFRSFFHLLFLHLKVACSPFTHSMFQVGPVALKKQRSMAEPAHNLDTKSILGKTLWRITNVISAGALCLEPCLHAAQSTGACWDMPEGCNVIYLVNHPPP